MTTMQIVSLLGSDPAAEMERDVREGLTAARKWLPPKYFYDAHGSALFEEITRLPEYYQTRAEEEILARIAEEVVAQVAPDELVELGSGACRKTRRLLDALQRHSRGQVYRPFDVSEEALRRAIEALRLDYSWLRIEGIVGDFGQHLVDIPQHGRSLVAFLGSTLGNLHPDEQPRFLRALTARFEPGDALLLGVDLEPSVRKSVAMLQAAYDDAAGVTAQFNQNVLHVLNRELGADFPVDDFSHIARYVPEEGWIEMALRAERPVTVTFPSIDLTVGFEGGEELRTEISCKFRKEQVQAMFTAAGLHLDRWDTDPLDRFAVALGVA